MAWERAFWISLSQELTITLLGVSIIPYIAKAQDDPDAIRDVPVTDSQTDSSTAPIYNLQGQRLCTPQRGVNIVGGKKIIVK